MLDELNIHINFTEEEILDELRQYFKPMEITEEQKEERVDVGYKIFDIMLFFFTLVAMSMRNNMLERTYLIEQLRQRWLEACKDKVDIDDYISAYVDEIVEDIVVVTLSHLESKTIEEALKEDNYFISDDRALEIAENEANSIMNYADLVRAKELGYTKKKWLTMRDKRVRKSHIKVDDKTIPIDDMFEVGDCLMYQPHDEFYGTAKECVNCRCSLKFYK